MISHATTNFLGNQYRYEIAYYMQASMNTVTHYCSLKNNFQNVYI